jgi:hypothetical protein
MATRIEQARMPPAMDAFEEFSLPPFTPLSHKPSQNRLIEDLVLDDSSNEIANDHPVFFTSKVSQRIGWYGQLALVGGTVCILAALSFLCFLWFSDSQNAAWRHLAIEGWMTRSITVTAIVIRVMVAAQAAVATSAIAALLLQRHEVALPQIAPISLIRANNTGPYSLLWRITSKQCFRATPLSILFLTILTTTTISSQFTSTILLSNVRAATIQNTPQSINITYGFEEWPTNDASPGVQLLELSSFAAFAEYTEPATPVQGVHDTGLTLRALFPITSNERQQMRQYSGKATVIDNRVVCVRPEFESLSLNPVLWWATAGTTNLSLPAISGRVKPEVFPPGLLQSAAQGWMANYPGNGSVMTFNCSTSTYDGEYMINSPKSVCFLEPNLGFRSPLYSNYTIQPYESGIPPGQFVQTYLVIQATGTFESWSSQSNGTADLASAVKDEEWLKVPLHGVDPQDTSMSFSLCFASPTMQYMDVNATRSSNTIEPSLNWNVSNAQYDTASARRQLGVAQEDISLADRGIFQLARQDDWRWPGTAPDPHWIRDCNFMYHGDLTGVAFGGTMIPDFGTRNYSFVVCPATSNCDSSGTSYNPPHDMFVDIHATQAALFNDVIVTTSRPALAIQALQMSWYRQTYYDWAVMFDLPSNATTQFTTQALIPVASSALIAVIAICTAHVVLIGTAMYFFVRYATSSLLDNTWSAVAQLSSDKLRPWLQQLSDKTDAEATALMKTAGASNQLFGISKVSGRLQIVRKRQRSASMPEQAGGYRSVKLDD